MRIMCAKGTGDQFASKLADKIQQLGGDVSQPVKSSTASGDTYIDTQGILGEQGASYSYNDLRTIYDSGVQDGDPSVTNYASFNAWFQDTVSQLQMDFSSAANIPGNPQPIRASVSANRMLELKNAINSIPGLQPLAEDAISVTLGDGRFGFVFQDETDGDIQLFDVDSGASIAYGYDSILQAIEQSWGAESDVVSATNTANIPGNPQPIRASSNEDYMSLFENFLEQELSAEGYELDSFNDFGDYIEVQIDTGEDTATAQYPKEDEYFSMDIDIVEDDAAQLAAVILDEVSLN